LSRRNLAERKLSAIEYTILGIAWKRGPCTTYALMRELQASTSTYYKSRAGTAYPVVERLVAAGLLQAEEATGAKGEKFVGLTQAGEVALIEWITPPIDPEDVAHTVDLLRLRVFYLGAADPELRSKYLDAAFAGLEAQQEELKRAMARYAELGDAFSEFATLGVLYETKARIDWLADVRDRIIAAPRGRPPTHGR
jgi:DNA-binding PadR family transcriptional regulator